MGKIFEKKNEREEDNCYNNKTLFNLTQLEDSGSDEI